MVMCQQIETSEKQKPDQVAPGQKPPKTPHCLKWGLPNLFHCLFNKLNLLEYSHNPLLTYCL